MNTTDTNVCFYSRSVNTKIFSFLGKKLEEKGYKTCYIIHQEKEKTILEDTKCRNNIYNITYFIESNWKNNALLASIDLSQIEQDYGIESLWSIYYTDRFLIYYTYEESIKFIKLHILFYLEIIKKEKINFFVYENISHFSSYIFFLLGKHHNVRYIGFSEARNFADKKFYFTNDEHSSNYLLNQYYQLNSFTANELSSSQIFIENYRKTKPKPEYMKIYGEKPKINFHTLKGLLKYPLYLFEKKDFYNYMDYNNKEGSPLRKLKFYFKYQYHKFYYKTPREGDKFYFFGLHFQPEATTLVNAQNYEKQLNAIDLIAKKIPIDSMLYIKEHYADLGHREIFFYKQLKKYPNIYLINPWENSRELIEKSLGVIALSGTIGWEGILLRKPVFLLGNMFYSSFRYTNKINNIDDLSSSIKKYKENIVNTKEYDEELLKYVSAYLKSLQNGSYIVKNGSVCMSEENRNNIYNSFINELTRLNS